MNQQECWQQKRPPEGGLGIFTDAELLAAAEDQQPRQAETGQRES